MSGWIKIHRKILDWEWYSCPNTKAVFLHCLLSANWEDKRWRGLEIKRGQLFGSYETIGAALGLSRQNVRTAFDKLKRTQEIRTQPTRSGLLITVCKFDCYNSGEDDDQHATNTEINRELTGNQHGANTELTPPKEYKNKKKGRNNNSSAGADWASCLPIPSDLPESVQSALVEWKRHRFEIRKKITGTQWERLVSDCRKNPSVMVAAIHRSVVSGWQGLFPEKSPNATHAQSRRPTINDYDNPANWTEDQFNLTPKTA